MLEINRDKLSSQRGKHQKKAAGKKAQKGVMTGVDRREREVN